MRDFFREIKSFLTDRVYCGVLFLLGICTYGFVITHYSVGIDDTAISLYFDEGIAPYVGRTTLYLINQVLPITKMSPFFIEFVSMLCMLFAATAWCVLWKKVCGRKVNIPNWMYLLAAGVFISCPLISEVYVFYLHNGICLAYGFSAAGLYALLNALKKGSDLKKRILFSALSSVFLSLALGCYESMILVYVMGAIMLFFLSRVLYGKKGEEAQYETNVLWWLFAGCIAVAGSLIIRSCIVSVLSAFHDWSDRFSLVNTSKRGSFFGKLKFTRDELVMNIKHFIMKYYVNAVCYLPIRMLVISYAVLGTFALIFSILKRDFWLFIGYIALPVLPVFMCLAGKDAFAYRTAQYVPVITAFAMLFLFVVIGMLPLKKKQFLNYGYGVLLGILIWSQCADINQWFMADYARYQHDKDTMVQIAKDLQAECDVNKPVIFVGQVEIATAVTETSTLSFSDERWRYICILSDRMDPTMKEKYYCQYGKGYHFRDSIFYSTINWGIKAFDLTPTQLTEFWKIHGYDFMPATDLESIKEAEELAEKLKLPEYPKDGYILECEDYIIISL